MIIMNDFENKRIFFTAKSVKYDSSVFIILLHVFGPELTTAGEEGASKTSTFVSEVES